MSSTDITLASRILDYQNDDNIIEFVNSRKCTKSMINEIGHNNMTALHIAASNNKHKVVEALLKKGADVNGLFFEKKLSGLPPLHMAIYYGSYDSDTKEDNLKTIKILLDANAQIDISSHTAFLLACIKSKNEVIKLLLNYDINIQFKDSTEKTGLDHMRYNKNGSGIKLVEAYMLEKALQEELTVPLENKCKKLKV